MKDIEAMAEAGLAQGPCDQPDGARVARGFLGRGDVAALAQGGALILDPGSTLISVGVSLAAGVLLWPGTVLEARSGGRIAIGARTQLYPGTRCLADGGTIEIGEEAEIGEEGGFTLKAEGAGVAIAIGAAARLLGGGSLTLANRIGRGAQILGPIRAQNCRLGDGGSHRDPEPDRRGGVLKGAGVARGLDVPQGMVIQAFGLFADEPMLRQSYFHPPAPGS